MSTAIALTNACESRGWWPDQGPHDERRNRRNHHQRNEPPRHDVCQPLDRRTRALRLGDHANDLGKQRVGADASRAHHDGSSAVHGASGRRIAGRFLDRDRFSGHHRFVHACRAIEDNPVDGDPFAGPHSQPIADTNIAEGHIALGSVRIDAPRRLRRKPEQGPNRSAGAAPRAELQHLAEQHKHNDDGGGFEIHSNGPAHAECVRKEIGRERRDDAEAVRRADAERDQREHVEVPAHERTPSRARKTASRPTARPASPGRAPSS